MKKLFLYSAALVLSLNSCGDDDNSTIERVSIETQNSYDDQAIQKFLNDCYFDAQGNVEKFSSTDASDDNYPSLATYSPVKLNSGVVYIVRPNAQPVTGATINDTDIIKLMSVSYFTQATETDDVVSFANLSVFRNNIGGTGVPENDPFFYYAKKSLRTQYSKERNYFEIEGFREAIKNFQSFEIPDSDSYNLQGVILVPSRAAYARDENVLDGTSSKFQDQSFIFNFQIYKTSARPADQL